jgi:hypothetical protein
MADRLKDNEDRKLESLFRSEPVPDDGFSARVMTRLNRRLWIRRLALPTAFIAGAAIALKPLSQLIVMFSKFLTLIPTDISGLPIESIPQASTIMLGCLLLAAMMMVAKMLED